MKKDVADYNVKLASYIIEQVGAILEEVRKHIPKRMKSARARFVVGKLASEEDKAKMQALAQVIRTFKTEYRDNLLRDLRIVLKHLDRAKQLDPRADFSSYYAAAHSQVSDIYNLAEDYPKSVVEAERAVQYAPTIGYYADYVIALSKEGKKGELIESAREAIRTGVGDLEEIQHLEESDQAKVILEAALDIVSHVEKVNKEQAANLYDQIADAARTCPAGLEAAIRAERLRYKQ